MSRTFSEGGLNRRERDELYRRQARLTRERDRFPFSNFNARAFAARQAFDRELVK